MSAPHLTEPVRFARAIQSHRRAMLRAMDEVSSHELTPTQRLVLDAHLQSAETAIRVLDPVGNGHLYKRKL